MGRFIGLLGYTVDDKAKELIAASRDWLKGVGVELLAAFGPAALLSLLARSAHQPNQAPQPQPQPQRKPKKAAKAIVAPIASQKPAKTPLQPSQRRKTTIPQWMPLSLAASKPFKASA